MYEKNFLGFILKILRVFITASFIAIQPNVANIIELARKNSEVEEEKEHELQSKKESEYYEISQDKFDDDYDEDEMMGQDVGTGMDIEQGTDAMIFQDEVDMPELETQESDKADKKTAHSENMKVQKRIEQLSAQLKGSIGSDLIDSIDFVQLQEIILRMISSLLSKEDLTYNEKKIIENSLSLWMGCILHNPDIVPNFYSYQPEEFKDSAAILMAGLTNSDEKIRDEFYHSILLFSTKCQPKDNSAFEYGLNTVINFEPTGDTHNYYKLVCSLVDEYDTRVKEGKAKASLINTEEMFSVIIDMIISHNSLELLDDSVKDETLIGRLKVAHKLLQKSDIKNCIKIAKEKGFMNEIFKKCLFPDNIKVPEEDITHLTDPSIVSISGNKCKSEESRKWAYTLLWTLCNESPELLHTILKEGMVPLCDKIKPVQGWNHIVSTDTRSQKYSGIKNLGCICYMNSMLQQFYNIPAFRYLILMSEDSQPDNFVEYKNRTINDKVLYQFQKMVSHLELSNRSDYNPVEFCFSFKDMDGLPTNTSVQHDTEEFFNIFVDRIENLLKPTPQKYAFSSIFGGKNCSQMVCQECGFVRNRFEDFYNISLTVKERKSVEDSLKKAIEGETISDFTCPGCKKKVDITKRTLISQTPNVLVFQLQRIIFDFETFQNSKVNSEFEFPNVLDLTPYTLNHVMKKDGKLDPETITKFKSNIEKRASAEEGVTLDEDLQDEGMAEEEKKERREELAEYEERVIENEEECYEYKLVGVTVHVGTADAGHYYSLINTDRFKMTNEDNDDWLKTENQKWMEFNDSAVSDYNFDDMKADCYGGTKNGGDDIFGGFFKMSSYGKSGYVLVYEKRKKKPVKLVIPKEEETQTESTSPECTNTASTSRKVAQIDYTSLGEIKFDKVKNE